MGSSRRKQLREGSGEAPAPAPGPGEEPPWASEIVQRVQQFLSDRDTEQAGVVTRSDVQVRMGLSPGVQHRQSDQTWCDGWAFTLVCFGFRNGRRKVSRAAGRSWSLCSMGWTPLAPGAWAQRSSRPGSVSAARADPGHSPGALLGDVECCPCCVAQDESSPCPGLSPRLTWCGVLLYQSALLKPWRGKCWGLGFAVAPSGR